MAVEVRQMIVKSNVLQRSGSDEKYDVRDLEESRESILEECKRLIQEALQDAKER
jgi:hypothetical protein